MEENDYYSSANKWLINGFLKTKQIIFKRYFSNDHSLYIIEKIYPDNLLVNL